MQIQSADTDMGDTESCDDEPKSRSAERFAARPDDVIGCSLIDFLLLASRGHATAVIRRW